MTTVRKPRKNTPIEPCVETNANQFWRVPYTATYYFYKSR